MKLWLNEQHCNGRSYAISKPVFTILEHDPMTSEPSANIAYSVHGMETRMERNILHAKRRHRKGEKASAVHWQCESRLRRREEVGWRERVVGINFAMYSAVPRYLI